MGCNGSAAIQAFKKGAYLANLAFTQIHPTCIPVHGEDQSKLTLMSESLRNDGRIWVPKKKEDAEAIRAGKKKPTDIPDEDRDFYLERRYPAFGNLCPRDIASRAAKERCDAGYGVGSGNAVYLDFKYAIERLGKDVVRDRYGNLFDMYQMISDDNPYETPMMIFPASHYTMGGIWVDYELQTSVKGLFAIGECNFSDHGANRLGASALMQGLADGYFVLPYTMQNYLSDQIKVPHFSTDAPEFDAAEKAVKDRIAKLMAIKGTKSPDEIHKRLGHVMWNLVGMGRTLQSLVKALDEIEEVRKEFYSDLRIVGEVNDLNTELEKALRLEDFLEIAKIIAIDALNRNESCGAHFREEYQTADGEAARRDDEYMYVSCWKYTGDNQKPILLKEPLKYEAIKVQTRNYKS
jgi:succinate dehydrogenase / fumarate reductase flavoprotein subunit